MSLTSIVKVLPEALRHPAGLAMVGSFAFHGFLFAGGLPLIPGDSDAVDSERLVSLIKLSPAEQGRLPQAASSQIAPLPEAPPPDLSSFVLPPMAKLPDVGQQPELFDLPSPSLPATPNLPSLGLGSIPSLGSAPPIRVSPGRPLPFISPSQIPSQSAKASSPFTSPSSGTPAPSPSPNLDQIMSGLQPGEVDDFGNSSPSDQQIDPSLKETFKDQPSSDQPAADASETSNDLDNLNQLIAKAREISGNPELRPENITVTPTYPKAACDDRPKGFAIVGAIVRPDGELAEAPTLQGSSGSKVLDDAALDTVSNYQFKPSGQYQAFFPTLQFEYSEAACAEDTASPSPSPSESPGTSNQSSNKSSANLSQWLKDSRQQSNSQLTLQPLTNIAPPAYPEAACKNQLEGQPQVTAKVNPDGKLAEAPVVTKSTGYQVLDTAAVEAVKNHQFAAKSQPQAYVFSPSFNYSEEKCSEAGASQSSSQTSEKATAKSLLENSSPEESSTSSQDSDSSSSNKKSNQPTSISSPKSSKGAASQSLQDSESEATSEESPDTQESTSSQESPDQETSDSEETAP